jgi:hypothetical protein
MAHLHVWVPDEQYPLRNRSFKTTDGFSNHNFTDQVVYTHPPPPTFSWFCQHALSPQIFMITVIMLILKQLYPRELQLNVAIRVLHGACAKMVRDLSTHEVCGIHECFFFLHTSEVYINVKGRHKTFPPSKLIMAILRDQKWQPSK